MGFEPEVLPPLWIAGGARSKALAVTGRGRLVGGRGLSECRAGNQRGEGECSDKRFHEASPYLRTMVRGLPQRQQPDDHALAVAEEVSALRSPDELYFGIDGTTVRSIP